MADNLPSSLTLSQLQGAAKDLAGQGAPREVVQGFVDNYQTTDNQNYTLKGSQTSTETPPTPTEGNPDSGINGDLFSKGGNLNPLGDTGKNIVNAVTSSEQNFGKDIAQGFYLAFGGQKNINNVIQQHLDSAAKLADLIKSNRHPEMNDQWKKLAESEIADAQKVGGSVIGNARTPEQIVGDAIGTAADIAAVGDYSGIAKSVGIVEKPAASILGGAAKGAVKGAIQGGAYGAVKGGAQGASDNKNAMGVATDAVIGGASGAVAGGAIGAVAGGAGAAMEGKPLKVVSDKEALNQTMSSLSGVEKKTAGARELTGSKLTGVKELPNTYDTAVAKTAKPFLDKNTVVSENNIKKEIGRISQKEILPQLESSSYKMSQGVKTGLVNKLNTIAPLDITKADPAGNTAFNLFKERVTSAVANAENDKSLFVIRQTLNDVANTQSGGKMWDATGKLNPIQEYWKQAYRTIGDLLKERNPQLAGQLDTQSRLFDALGGVAEKNAKLIGKTGALRKVVGKAGKAALIGAAGAIGAGGIYEAGKKLLP